MLYVYVYMFGAWHAYMHVMLIRTIDMLHASPLPPVLPNPTRSAIGLFGGAGGLYILKIAEELTGKPPGTVR
jgi:hypothetical protein